MIDLKELCENIYTIKEFDEYFNQYKKERVEEGVSNLDVMTLGDYLDEVIFNSLRKFVDTDPVPPEGVSDEEWIDTLTDMAALAGLIVTNNNKLNSLTIDDMYTTDIDNIRAENFAYRDELMQMMNEIWEYLYV